MTDQDHTWANQVELEAGVYSPETGPIPTKKRLAAFNATNVQQSGVELYRITPSGELVLAPAMVAAVRACIDDLVREEVRTERDRVTTVFQQSANDYADQGGHAVVDYAIRAMDAESDEDCE